MQQDKDPTITQMLEQTKKMQEGLNKGSRSSNPMKSNVEDILGNTIKNHESEKIGGKDYKIKKYGVRDWLQVTPYLGKIFAPATTLVMNGSIDEGALVLFSELEGGVLESVVDVLLKNVTLDDNKVSIDDFDNPMELVQLCIKVVKLNYEDVFTQGMKGLMQAAAHLTQKAATL